MQEDFIHYLWKFKKLSGIPLTTTDGVDLVIQSLGSHNFESGPDFFNARLKIGNQQWAGNVEMHVKASDWFLHGHDDDPAYDNVILHVVWQHDAEISTRDGIKIPVLEVSRFVLENLVMSYRKLFAHKNNQFINCEQDLPNVNEFKLNLWLEKLFINRLQQKSARIRHYLKQSNNDWEAAFFQLLARSFGTKTNADAFEQLAQSIDQATVRKLARDSFQLESALLGQSGLLDEKKEDRYYELCVKEYAFAKAKYQIQPSLTPMKFFRLRPANFPTVRISQLAMLYHRKPMLFAEVLLAVTKEDVYNLFEVKASKYWDDHHVFDKKTNDQPKRLTKAFIDLIIINCIVPIKFYYGQQMGKENTEELLALMDSVKAESNAVINGFKKLINVKSALTSQSLLQLKPNYCDRNKCLQCDVGVSLVRN
ncbi:DUF2851 family protein [Nonlabens tegetincola]|uniref:DUF2851 family protein n=1 Tax=Nonlabens tegetincola TaxID=323273 RepID=UPI0030C7E564